MSLIENTQKDAERFRFLCKVAQERLLRPGTLNSEFPDMRTHWVLPTLMCSGPIGGYLSFEEAVDIEMEKHNEQQKRLL